MQDHALAMIDFADMTLGDVIHESQNSIVYRAARSDGTSVIVKLPPEEFPSYQRFARMQREYEMTRLCGGDGVIRALDFVRAGSCFAMVLEDIDGHSLSHYMKTGQVPDLVALLLFASKAAAALGSIHGKRVMHKDISPGNIVWNQEDGSVKILDFGISTKLSRENPSVVSPNVLEGTLAYMSPEQTGRMNRALDYRTDLYSLGATLYHLFTGRMPFDGTDAMGLVHAHIAQIPRPAHEVEPEVPVMVARIIAKLMAKNAEDRYQSTSACAPTSSDAAENWRMAAPSANSSWARPTSPSTSRSRRSSTVATPSWPASSQVSNGPPAAGAS